MIALAESSYIQREYLFRTFLAGKKRAENYVINRLWQRLDDLDLKPIAQQYVDRGDGTYALLDLYFPQLNIGIECDEAQHLNTVDADRARTTAITRSISMDQKVGAIRAADVTVIERVAATDDIEAIHARIEDVIHLIQKKKATVRHFRAWDPTLTDTRRALDRRRIAATDDLFFRTTRDIRPLFALSEVSVQRALYRVAPGEATRLWCIRLVDKSGTSTASNGIENRTSADWTVIHERGVPGQTPLRQEDEPFNRIVFARSRNALGEAGYRFLGVFHKTGATTRLDDGGPFVVHERISASLDLNHYFDRIALTPSPGASRTHASPSSRGKHK
jgi:hypothetical protein